MKYRKVKVSRLIWAAWICHLGILPACSEKNHKQDGTQVMKGSIGISGAIVLAVMIIPFIAGSLIQPGH